ncbi:712_t:CDS:2 [Ambispora gerdemannii]|uniref:712_t:CDS:1 n=1 Tax=Ambispora gerdemannii TaxID=144530 RepID=A0A9N8VL55_9GLOM|nr:712_t:CDS:2 [Ambispora gerdemannii]
MKEGCNQHKFKSFLARIENIDINVRKLGKRKTEELEYEGEVSSFFKESLESWRELNLTANFCAFVREVYALSGTLVQVVHHAEEIVVLLKKHLQIENNMAIEPLLSLTVNLAKDLGEDFYPHYASVLTVVLRLAKQRDADVLEWTFNCVAYLFKLLVKPITKDLKTTHNLLAPLLGEEHHEVFIRKFSAQAFSFLLRKVSGSDLEDFFQYMFQSLKDQPTQEYYEGLSMLYHETIKSVNTRLHSKAVTVIQTLLSVLYKELDITNYKYNDTFDFESNLSFRVLKNTIISVIHHTSAEYFTPVLDCFLAELQTQANYLRSENNQVDMARIIINLSMCFVCVATKQGSCVSDIERVFCVTRNLAPHLIIKNVPDQLSGAAKTAQQQIIKLSLSLLLWANQNVVKVAGKKLISQIFECNDVNEVLFFSLALSKHNFDYYPSLIIPNIIKFCTKYWQTCPEKFILFLSYMISTGGFKIPKNGTTSQFVTGKGSIKFPINNELPTQFLQVLRENYEWIEEAELSSYFDINKSLIQVPKICLVASTLRIIPGLELEFSETIRTLTSLINSLVKALEDGTSSKYSSFSPLIERQFTRGSPLVILENLLGLAIETFTNVCALAGNQGILTMNNLWKTVFYRVLMKYNHNEVILRAVEGFLSLLRTSSKISSRFSCALLAEIYPILKTRINSFEHYHRLYTLKILSLFDQYSLKPTENTKKSKVQENSISVDRQPCEIFKLALAVEQIEPTIDKYREKIVKLKIMVNLVTSGRVPAFYVEVLPRVCLGFFTHNISPLWPEAIKALVKISHIYEKRIWNLLYLELSRFKDQENFAYHKFSSTALTYYFKEKEKQNMPSKAVKIIGGLSFECPHLNKYNQIIKDSEAFFSARMNNRFLTHFISLCSPSTERYDYWKYYTLLINTLTEAPHLAEHDTIKVVPFFLEFACSDMDTVTNSQENTENNPIFENMDIDKEEPINILQRTPKTCRNNLIAFLQLFTKFKNPAKAHQSEELKEVLMQLLSNGDPQLQTLSLNCLFAWKSQNVIPYENNLRNLLDETKFRDELSTFSLSKDKNGAIKREHREEVIELVLRVLYGRMIARRNKDSAKAGMKTRRTAVLAALNNCHKYELNILIDLVLQPFAEVRKIPGVVKKQFSFIEDFDISKFVSSKKQMGYLNMLDDLLRQLGAHISLFIPDLFKILLYIVHDAQKKLAADMDPDRMHIINSLKSIRQLGFKRMIQFFELPGFFDYTPYMKAMFDSFISPKIPKWEIENTQAPSALMELFATWSSRKEYLVFFTDYNNDVLPKLFACLSAKKVQRSVYSMILEIIENILKICDNDEPEDIENFLTNKICYDKGLIDELADKMCDDADPDNTENSLTNKVLMPHVSSLFDHLEFVISNSSLPQKDKFAKREITILSHIAGYVNDSEQAKRLIELLMPYLRKPTWIIQEKTKLDILCIFLNIGSLIPGFIKNGRYYNFISELLGIIDNRECRNMLVLIFKEFASREPELSLAAGLISDLNSYSINHLDTPDFDTRLKAFNRINSELYGKLRVVEWTPMLYNCLHFAQDPEEPSIRNNASFTLKRFIDRLNENFVDDTEKSNFNSTMINILFPGIKRGLKNKFEIVRVEFLSILSHAVKNCPNLPQFADMQCLLFNNDEEANIFNNIYHIQIHRRIRALTRLANECAAGKLNNTTLSQIFLPLVSHFIFEADKVTDHNLINETITTLGTISSQLSWRNYYLLLKQFLKLTSHKKDLEKILVRVVISILDNFQFNISSAKVTCSQVESDATPLNDATRQNNQDIDENEEENGMVIEEDNQGMTENSVADKIHDTVVNFILPELKQYLTQRDRENITIRVPIALAITKLLITLPEASLRISLPGLLTTVCQILRSRSQDVRDTTRNTLVKISNLLGPMYFSFIVKELKAALTQGYQLHVLGYTLHSLLLDLVPILEVGAIDYCVYEVTEILINDVFGEVGQEKDIDEITGKTKEMKSKKSFDSFELLAKVIEFRNIDVLLLPLKNIMRETQNVKILNKVDEVLQRISSGLNANTNIPIVEMMSFCSGLISQNLEMLQDERKTKVKKTNLEENFTVQLRQESIVRVPVDYLFFNGCKFVEFGFRLLLVALKRGKVDTKSDEHLKQLDKFVDIVGDAIYSKHTSINILALKIMCVMCKLPLPSLQGAFLVLDTRLVKLASDSDASTELVQNCFRLLTVLIRDCQQQFNIKLNELKYLVNLILPNIEEPEMQPTQFPLIRAIISRKYLLPEIYELIDKLKEIMVTSQSANVREQCRIIFFNFLLDYPQSDTRLKNEMNFLVANLEYTYESGRQSVLEMLNSILLKFPVEITREYLQRLFLSLSLRLVNDEAKKCKEMSGELIKMMLRIMSEDQLDKTIRLLNKWFDQNDQPNFQKMSSLVYGLLIEEFNLKSNRYIPELLVRLATILTASRDRLKAIEESEDEEIEMFDWEVVHYSLGALTKIMQIFPTQVYTEYFTPLWPLVHEHLLHPRKLIRLSSSRIFGRYFANIDPQIFDKDKTFSYVTPAILKDLVVMFCEQLKSQYLSTELATQIVKNLFFIGKCFFYMRHATTQTELEAETDVEAATININEENERNQEANSLRWLFNKLSYQARSASTKTSENIIQLQSVFKWFASMVIFMPPESLLNPDLVLVISPIYRLINDQSLHGEKPESLRNLGQEVLTHVQNHVGTTLYHNAYNQVRNRVAEVRKARKEQKAIKNLVDPAAAARKKTKKRENENKSKKRRKLDNYNNKEGKQNFLIIQNI